MSALMAHLRAEARRRWPAWVAVVLLIGVVGGLVLGSLAGARRTATAFDRMASRTNAADVLVNPDEGTDSALRPEDVASLPGVRQVGVGDGAAVLLGADGGPDPYSIVIVQRDPGVFVDIERPRVVDGRLFDPADADHVMVTDDLAERLDLEVGDTLPVGTILFDEYAAWEEAGRQGPEPIHVHDQTVTAVVVTADGVVDDEVFSYGTAFLTHAFSVEQQVEPFFFGMFVDLEDGPEAAGAFRAAVRDLVPDEAIEFKTLSAITETVERGTRPHVIALLVFAAVVGVAGIVVCGQAVGRQHASLAADAAALRALGVGRRGLRLAAGVRALLLVVAGAAVAVVVAILGSSVFPLGVARRAEMSPGLDVDVLVLGLGASVIALVLLGWTALSVRRLGTGASARRAPTVGVLQRVVRSSSSPVASTGIRAAVAPSNGSPAGSARAALGGLAVAVGAVAAAMTFGAGLAHFVTSPSAYGWPWDAVMSLPSDDEEVTDEVLARIAGEPRLRRHAVLSLDQLALDGERVPAVGTVSGNGAGLTIVEGRRPARPDEIALGGRTMDRLGVGIGDDVIAGEGDGGRALTVVGQAVFPGVGTYSGADRTELGKGALLDAGTLAAVGEGFGFLSVAVEASDPTALRAGLRSVTGGYEHLVAEGQIEIIDDPQRPSDVLNLERVEGTPISIAAVLASLAGAAFAFVLVSGVRGRRRELALLKTFGFSRRDVAGTVVWQSSVTALVALAVGLPLGVVVGRLTWSALADGLGIAPDPRLPVSLLAVPFVVLLLANVVAVVPGSMAARTRPALSLRSE